MTNGHGRWMLAGATFLLASALSFIPLLFLLHFTPLQEKFSSQPSAAALYSALLASAMVGALVTWLGESRFVLRKLAVLVLLLLSASFLPVPSQITTCRYCIWTIAGEYNEEWRSGEPVGYYFNGTVWDFRAGRNDEEINRTQRSDPYKDYKWHRVRLGIPLQSITIDKMDNVNDWHMVFEGWFWFNLMFWLALWFLYQFGAFVTKHLKTRLKL